MKIMIAALGCMCSYESYSEFKNISTFLQRDTDDEVKEHLRNNLHLQEKVM